MPLLIEHIDAIARTKGRDALFVTFHVIRSAADLDPEVFETVDWKTLPIRQKIIDWLDDKGIAWTPCGEFANENVMMSYTGSIYIDLPFDRSLPGYRALEAFLETPGGRMRFPDATFCYLPLERAMVNAAHDEPGFWERWAERF